MNLSEAIITEISGVMTVHSKKGDNTRMQNRPCYGLSLCYGGQITYRQNGREYISNKNVAIILPMGESYEIVREKTGDFPVINFKTQKPLSKEFKVIELKEGESIFKNYEEIKRLSLDKSNRMKVMSLFYEILDSLTSAKEYGILDPAVRYVYNNYHKEEICNSLLAEKCEISEVYFRKLFKESFKLTPKQFIIKLRIKKAKQLLKEGRESIVSVSEQCGFTSQYHFCRTFKSYTGITPTEYRQNHLCSRLEFV